MADTIEAEDAQQETRKSRKNKEQDGLWGFIKDFVPTFVVALGILALVTHFLARPFMIPSGSMEQTLNIGDRILVNKLTPGVFNLQRGDVVVFEKPEGWDEGTAASQGPVMDGLQTVGSWLGVSTAPGESFLVKRIIGMPGDHVQTDGTNIKVNGTIVNEPFLYPGNNGSDVPFDVTVPEGQLWVMGDHRSNSADSRYHMKDPSGGFVPIKDVQGKAFLKFYPFSDFGTISAEPNSFSTVPAPTAVPAAQ